MIPAVIGYLQLDFALGLECYGISIGITHS